MRKGPVRGGGLPQWKWQTSLWMRVSGKQCPKSWSTWEAPMTRVSIPERCGSGLRGKLARSRHQGKIQGGATGHLSPPASVAYELGLCAQECSRGTTLTPSSLSLGVWSPCSISPGMLLSQAWTCTRGINPAVLIVSLDWFTEWGKPSHRARPASDLRLPPPGWTSLPGPWVAQNPRGSEAQWVVSMPGPRLCSGKWRGWEFLGCPSLSHGSLCWPCPYFKNNGPEVSVYCQRGNHI